MVENRSQTDQPPVELPEARGLFGPMEVIPLVSDLIPGPIVDAVVLGYCRRQPQAVSGLAQNDGRIFPQEERKNFDTFSPYCNAIRCTPGGRALCQACDVAGIKLMLGKTLTEAESKLVEPVEPLAKGATCYICHAGNLEVIVPVTLRLRDVQRAPSAHIGAFWGGQCRIQNTAELSHIFARVAETTGLADEHLRMLFEQNRKFMDEDAIRQLQEELLHMSDAMSKSVTISYHVNERLRADKLTEHLGGELARLLGKFSSGGGNAISRRDQIRDLMRSTLIDFVKQYRLLCSVVYFIEDDPQTGTITLNPCVGDPKPHTYPIVISRTSLNLRRGLTARRDASNAGDNDFVRKILATWRADPETCGVSYLVFSGARTGLRLWVSIEKDNPQHDAKFRYIHDGGVQPAFENFLRDASKAIAGGLDIVDLLKEIDAKRAQSKIDSDKLRRAKEDLENQQQETRRLVMRMAHLVSRPILELELAASALKANPAATNIRDHFGGCLFELRRASRTFKTFDDLASSRGIASSEKPQPLDIVELLEEAITVIRPLSQLNRHAVELTASQAMTASPRKIIARRSTVAEIIENLLHNAIKYSLGGREVEVHVQEQDRGVEVLFTDYGCGIGDDEKKRVFDLSYRSPMAKRLQVEGSGIGLWVAMQLAKLNEGILEVVSCDPFDYVDSKKRKPEPRYKVVFRLWLPVK